MYKSVANNAKQSKRSGSVNKNNSDGTVDNRALMSEFTKHFSITNCTNACIEMTIPCDWWHLKLHAVSEGRTAGLKKCGTSRPHLMHSRERIMEEPLFTRFNIALPYNIFYIYIFLK